MSIVILMFYRTQIILISSKMDVTLLITCLTIIVLTIYLLTHRKFYYWNNKNVKFLKPILIFGNYIEYILLRKPIGEVAQEICKKFPDEPYVGTYFGTEPALIVQDPDLIKLVLAQEFNSFSGREVSKYCDYEHGTKSMFFIGGDIWKILRKNLTPLFTSVKMKNMFYLIQNCRDTFEELLKKEISASPTQETKQLVTKYIIDCIGACFFGIDTNAMSTYDKKNPFTAMGNEVANSKALWRFKYIIRSMWPYIFYRLRCKMYSDEVTGFFYNALTRVFQNRQYKQTPRNDMVDLLMSWNQDKYISDGNAPIAEDTRMKLEVNDDLLVSQCVLFFAAGHETSSIIITFCLYELAKNKKAQAKLIEEVDTYFKKNNGMMEFECINELPYLEACIDETMRLHPIFGLLTREVMHAFTLPSGLHLEEGVRIHIPIYHLHHNPKYFPQPEQFRPERFFDEEKNNVIPYTFLPFGEGPRICIGMRMSKMQMFPAFLTIFKDYEVELAEGMPTKLKYLVGGISTQAAGGVNLKFIKRNKI